MRSVILSQWRERRMGVIWQDLIALTTVRARKRCLPLTKINRRTDFSFSIFLLHLRFSFSFLYVFYYSSQFSTCSELVQFSWVATMWIGLKMGCIQRYFTYVISRNIARSVCDSWASYLTMCTNLRYAGGWLLQKVLLRLTRNLRCSQDFKWHRASRDSSVIAGPFAALAIT